MGCLVKGDDNIVLRHSFSFVARAKVQFDCHFGAAVFELGARSGRRWQMLTLIDQCTVLKVAVGAGKPASLPRAL